MRGGSVTWEFFKKAFLDRFFPRDMRKAKAMKFINHHKRGMSVH